jgi:hypothetical protein
MRLSRWSMLDLLLVAAWLVVLVCLWRYGLPHALLILTDHPLR